MAERTLTAPGYFEDYHEVADVADFPWPDPAKYIDPAECLKAVSEVPEGSDIIPDLIEAGVDVIHPIQALATNMELGRLSEHFSQEVSFCGGVDAQELLVNGKPEEVRAKVKELRSIFPTGLIISPSHEVLLADIPPANIQALFEEVHRA